MQRNIIFITGGARSGKSSFAIKEVSGIHGEKAFLATAEALDEEMKERIYNHKKERGDAWDTYEEPVKIADLLSAIQGRYRVVLIDCLTLWLSNILHQKQHPTSSIQHPEDEIMKLVDELLNFKNPSHVTLHRPLQGVTHHASQLFIVSNEVGMGIVPDNPLAREFRDLAGSLNQKIAELADEVYLVAARISIQIK